MSAPLSSQFFIDRAEIIDLVKPRSCNDIKLVQAANNYDDLFALLFEFVKLWDCDPAHLDAVVACVEDDILLAYGVYRNKVGPSVTNPRMLINSQYGVLLIDAGGDYGEVEITKGSTVGELIIENNTQVPSLAIGSSSVVSLLRVASGSCIDTLLVKACDGNNSTLTKIVSGSCVNDMTVDDDATFDGYDCEVTNPYV